MQKGTPNEESTALERRKEKSEKEMVAWLCLLCTKKSLRGKRVHRHFSVHRLTSKTTV